MGSTPVAAARTPTGVFVVHEHSATRLHWDLRLEIDGVLCSWAVPHGPSMNPDDKRLAVKVENHPLEYIGFEAVIPAGNYGAGPMIAWDRGLWMPASDPAEAMRAGEIKFELRGYKLRGAFTLVHTGRHGRGQRGGDDWLLIKKRDAWAETFLAEGRPLSPASVLSGLTVEELRDGARRMVAIVDELAARKVPRKAIAAAGFKPMLCQTAEAAFSAPDWVFELKYDGYRLVAHGGAGRARLYYRSGLEATERFPEIASAIAALPVAGVVLDGEVVVTDGDGKPVFNLLQQRSQLDRASDIQKASAILPATYFCFDLLGLAGHDLRNLPLIERKAYAQRLLPPVGPLRYADHVEGLGVELLAQVASRGLEGVVAKKADSVYRPTRSRDWLKLKRDPEDDFVICGYSPPKGSRTGFGALYLTVRDGAEWIYAGKVGSGFDEKELVGLKAELDALPRWKPSFPKPEGSTGAKWIQPSVVCTIRYREWPGEHAVRFPVFLHLRRDKLADECTVPSRVAHPIDADDAPPPAPEIVHDPQVRELRLSNLKKVYWPADGYTKGDLIDYYRAIAPWILPYTADRPAVITRYPDGIDGKMFYQKDMPDWVPPWLRTTTQWSEGAQREIHYVLVDDADGLAYLANLGSIPLHVWASRITDLARPDWTIIDFDPKNAPRENVVPLALATHELCESIELPNFIKTSGQTGLHILIPLGGQCTHDQARTLAYLLALIVERRHPTMATTLRNPDKRGGKVYLDWGQNAQGQLLVAPFSVRPVPGARVSMPITWAEVGPDLDVGAFTIKTALDRLERHGDPMRPVLTERPDLAAALERLTALVGDT